MKSLFITALVALLLFLQSLNSGAQEIVVKINNGQIRGKSLGEVKVFKGIPYAASPIGELRWKAPEPVKDWQGVKNCLEFSASPVQTKPAAFMMWTEEFIAPPEPLSEDCLYLNVWTPSLKAGSKLPVFVWIYGGGFVAGSSACAVYDGEEYARRGIVFVSINYRLGVFGFLAHPDLSKESGYHSSGNYGLLDQLMALKWIKSNILNFGGDPENVTIAGQSAGSMSVTALLASPLGANLFEKAIAESGGIFSGRFSASLTDAEKSGVKFMEHLHASNIAELRKLPSDEILKNAWGEGFGRYAPILDGYVLSSNPADLFEGKSFNNVPVIAGWVTGDASLASSKQDSKTDYIKKAKEKYGNSADEFLNIFPAETEEQAKQSQQEIAMISFAGMPAHILAGINHKPTYLYEYSHVPVDKPGFPNYGAFHTSEVPFVLHTLHKWNRPWRPTDYKLEEILTSYWIQFARTGNPNSKGLPEWKSYDKQTDCIMELGDSIALKPALYKREMEFLKKWK